MSTLFISDLHLSAERENITELFINFLEQRASQADALYILGDLFEVWLGDDFVSPDYQQSLAKMKQLADSGLPIYFMSGNRDFLISEKFTELSGATLLDEPHIIDLYGTATLLMHGDTLCTDDIEYQKFRKMVRDPNFITDFLSKSVEERITISSKYREISKTETSSKKMDIMDVNQAQVEASMTEYKVHQLIHGHTHRPAIHNFTHKGKAMKRIVLGDWYKQGSVLVCNEKGCELESISSQLL